MFDNGKNAPEVASRLVPEPGAATPFDNMKRLLHILCISIAVVLTSNVLDLSLVEVRWSQEFTLLPMLAKLFAGERLLADEQELYE